MDIWDVAIEPGFGVVVGQEAGVLKFPSEDCHMLAHSQATCERNGVLSTRKTSVLALEPSFGAAT